MIKPFGYILGLILIGVLSFAPPLALLTTPKPVEAAGLPVFDKLNMLYEEFKGAIEIPKIILTAISTSAIVTSVGSLNIKETILDPLAWFVTKAIIRAMTRSIVNWINSGFQGSPMFVSNPEAFLLDIIDAEIGNFIYGTELGFLCDPFQLQIRIALATRYSRDTQVACRLTQIGDNLTNFFNSFTGSFENGGGWGTWFVVVSEENPYNRYLETQRMLDSRIANYINEVNRAPITKLEWSSGFFSFEDCKTIGEGNRGLTSDDTGPAEYTSDDTGDSRPGSECEIKTPGAFIEDQLANVAGSGIRQLELADEFNEIIDALFSQLVVQAMGGIAGGLSGLSSSEGGRPSILDQMANVPLLPPGSIDTSNESDPRIRQELEYKSSSLATLNRVRETESRLAALPACIQTKANAYIASKITPLKTELEAQIASADSNINAFRSLKDRLAAATDPAVLESISREIARFEKGGTLHTTTNISDEQVRKANLEAELVQNEQQLQAEGQVCVAEASLPSGTSGGIQFSTE